MSLFEQIQEMGLANFFVENVTASDIFGTENCNTTQNPDDVIDSIVRSVTRMKTDLTCKKAQLEEIQDTLSIGRVDTDVPSASNAKSCHNNHCDHTLDNSPYLKRVYDKRGKLIGFMSLLDGAKAGRSRVKLERNGVTVVAKLGSDNKFVIHTGDYDDTNVLKLPGICEPDPQMSHLLKHCKLYKKSWLNAGYWTNGHGHDGGCFGSGNAFATCDKLSL